MMVTITTIIVVICGGISLEAFSENFAPRDYQSMVTREVTVNTLGTDSKITTKEGYIMPLEGKIIAVSETTKAYCVPQPISASKACRFERDSANSLLPTLGLSVWQWVEVVALSFITGIVPLGLVIGISYLIVCIIEKR